MQHPLHARDGASSSSSPSLVINHSSPLLQSHNFNSHTTIKNGKRNNSARHTNNTNNSPHNNNNPHTSIINDVNNKNNNDEQVNQVNQVSQSNRKVQLHQIYRMYENDRINEMCSASDDSPKVYAKSLYTIRFSYMKIFMHFILLLFIFLYFCISFLKSYLFVFFSFLLFHFTLFIFSFLSNS